MLRLVTECHGFRGALTSLNGRHEIQLTLDDLIRAAITVGYSSLPGAIGLYPSNQWWAAAFRVTVVRAYLAERGARLARSAAYDRSDPSEKGMISYYLGLAVSK